MVFFRDILVALNIKSSCCNKLEKQAYSLTLDQTMPIFVHIKKIFSLRSQTYEFTQTFNLSGLNIPEDRHEQLLYRYYEVSLYKLREKNIYYILFPEHTEAGVLHFHGIISAPNYHDWCFTKRLLRKHGFISTNQMDMYGDYKLKKKISNAEGWIFYILKDRNKENYKNNPILAYYACGS